MGIAPLLLYSNLTRRSSIFVNLSRIYWRMLSFMNYTRYLSYHKLPLKLNLTLLWSILASQTFLCAYVFRPQDTPNMFSNIQFSSLNIAQATSTENIFWVDFSIKFAPSYVSRFGSGGTRVWSSIVFHLLYYHNFIKHQFCNHF